MAKNTNLDIKEFTLEFFRSLGCTIKTRKNLVVIENVPRKFENLYGKSSPYVLTFDPKYTGGEAESIIKNSHLLLCIDRYLGDFGKTNIFKIDLGPKVLEKAKKESKLKDYKIVSVKSNGGADHFYKFTFVVTFQYFNEKEDLLHEVCTKDGKIFDFHANRLKIVPEEKKEGKFEDVDKQYKIARAAAFEKVRQKKEYAYALKSLNKKFEREIERIHKHYVDQLSEKDYELDTAKMKLEQLKSKLGHMRDRKEIKNLQKNIAFKEEQVKGLKNVEYRKRLEEERQFFIDDEKNKFALNIHLELFNVSVFYYEPSFELGVVSKKGGGKSKVTGTYDPVTGEFDYR